MNVNIGGGQFNHPGWINFDQRAGFRFDASTVFPVERAEIVYSSHCLEHLDDETVDRVLSEARRLGKRLVLKLPDFDQVLERWEIGDRKYFDRWGLDDVTPTWRGTVQDTINSRAAMIFCGWWNDAYGDEWGTRTPNAKGAYHGPVVMPDSSYKVVLSSGTPHSIAHSFVARAFESGARYFNHRNAWSIAELVALLHQHRFAVESADKDVICALNIPGIEDMRDISIYVLAR